MAYDDGYVHQAGRTSAARRRRRATVTLLLVFGLLVAAFTVALGFNQGWFHDRSPLANPTAACVPWTAPPKPADISVNVYNTTDRSGIATTASQDLAGQKFRIVGVGNDPLRRTVDGVAEIRYAKPTLAQAKVLAARFPGAKLVENKETDGILDVALGTGFTKVARPKSPTPPPNAC